jgi:putative two-component system response regulator
MTEAAFTDMIACKENRACLQQEKMQCYRQIENSLREISAAQQATNFALAKLAEYRDEDTGLHLKRVSEYCRILGERLQADSPYSSQISDDFIHCIQHASLLHDIGKVAIPDSILFKPGKLTTEEFEVMKTHTVIGAENIQAIYNHYSNNPLIGMGIEIALYHHERWDGQGYPDRLAGKNIPLSARIMAVADVYDALRSDRCYRKGFEYSQVKSMVVDGSGNHFDPVIVSAFIEATDEFIQAETDINQKFD